MVRDIVHPWQRDVKSTPMSAWGCRSEALDQPQSMWLSAFQTAEGRRPREPCRHRECPGDQGWERVHHYYKLLPPESPG